ncbi:MAG TPA: hypothetical protein VMZ53_21955, partial [Kofleriaceae bacterium]|nr:hypothetical protein [Kofleriaceae bacterium]
MDRDPLTAIAWQFRTNQFGDLVKHVRDHTAMVGMELLALSGAKRSATLPTVWSQLPRHPNVLEPLRGDQSRFLLRYAALNWTEPPFLRVDQERLAATQLFQLASVYQMLFETTGKNVGLFRNPLVKIDLGGFIRVCFLPMKPITVRPRVTVESDVDQQHLVRLVGECARRSLSITEGSLRWDILERCLTHNKQHQYKSLEDLMAACRLAGIEYPVERTGQLSAAWLEMEQGLGWLQLPQIRDYLDRASDHFGASLELVRLDYRDAQHELVRAVASWGRGTCAV